MRQRAYRSLERSIPLLIAAGIAFFSALQVISVSLTVRTMFSELEERELEGRRDQFRVLLRRESAGLESLAKSYAEWRDSYEYMESLDPAYISSNFGDGWKAAQDLDVVFIVDADGGLVWSSDSGMVVAGQVEPNRFSTRDHLLFPARFGELPPSSIVGFAVHNGMPALYASCPITNDAASEPPRGLLVFVRYFDAALLEAFSPGAGFRVSFLPGGAVEPGQSALMRIEKGERGVELVSYEEVRDPEGGFLGYWHYGMATAWLEAAGSLVGWLALIASISGFGCYAVSASIVHSRMVKPIRLIRDHLDRFSETFAAGSPLATIHADELGELTRHVNSLVERVETQTRELDRLAGTDGLTGLANRRRLDETLGELACMKAALSAKSDSRAPSKRGSVACGLIDIDFFKRYNDLYGHAEGDEALRKIASAIRAGVKRPDDLPSRYGGEEFVVVLPDTDEAGAVAVLERIRASIEALGIVHGGSDVAGVVTVSAGVAILPGYGGPRASENLLGLADRALYAAKDGGRNRVVAASTLPAS